MSNPADLTKAASDPASDDYDPNSPHYDVTADSSSPFYVGPVDENAARSGDEIRAEVTEAVKNDPLAAELSEKELDAEIQRRYLEQLERAQSRLEDELELRQVGDAPRTLWGNASHEQMVQILNSNADSAAIAETSEEWVRLGNDLTEHQLAVAGAIDDSTGDWQGEGGDAARRHLAEVAKWLRNTAQGAELTGRQQQIHSQTLNETQKQMAAHPPVQFDVHQANAQLQQITDPIAYGVAAGQAVQTMQQQQAEREQAARIMMQFDGTVGTAVQMPLFSPPPKLASATAQHKALRTTTGGGAGSGAGAGAGGMGASGLASKGMDAGGINGAGGMGPGSVGGAGGMGPGGMGAGGAGGVGGAMPGGPADPYAGSKQVADPAAFNAPQPNLSQFNPGGGGPGGPGIDVPAAHVGDLPGVSQPGGGGMPSTPGLSIPDYDDSTVSSSYSPPDLTQQPGFGKTPGWSGGVNGDIGSRLSGLGGPGSGGVPGGLPTGGVVPGGGGGGAAGLGGGAGLAGGGAAGASSGAAGKGALGGVPPGVAGQGMSGRAGMSGMSGMGGMPMGAGAGKKGEDDKEHRVAGYLGDDSDIFASEQAIAPPVIGDWQKNKDEDWK